MTALKLKKQQQSFTGAKLSVDERFKMRVYRPAVNFCFTSGNFTVKTANQASELEEIFRLRFNVFMKEVQKRDVDFGYDIEKYDFVFDHIIIKDDRTGRIAGVYRASFSELCGELYAKSEFHIDRVLNLPGSKLELGRACIHPQYRSGQAVSALWKGIGRYIAETGARYLLGCSSINCTDRFRVAIMHNYLRENFYSEKSERVKPRLKYRFKGIKKYAKTVSHERFDPFRQAAVDRIPNLLMTYLKAGGKVCGAPALDRSFKCIDYFTLLDTENMNRAFARKFLGL